MSAVCRAVAQSAAASSVRPLGTAAPSEDARGIIVATWEVCISLEVTSEGSLGCYVLARRARGFTNLNSRRGGCHWCAVLFRALSQDGVAAEGQRPGPRPALARVLGVRLVEIESLRRGAALLFGSLALAVDEWG